MTEITTPASTELAETVPQIPQTAAVIQLGEWAAELAAARQLAQVLAASSFLPMALRKKGNNGMKNLEELTYDAAAVILAGKSVGLDPMQAVQNIFPVHGMPSMYARTMVALVIAQGHDVRRTDATDKSVTYSVRRKGDEDWQDFTWTIARAATAGYTSNAKYKSDPIAMLGAKAAAEACRTVFPDILLGMAYSAEEIELEDMGEKEQPAESTTARLARLSADRDAAKAATAPAQTTAPTVEPGPPTADPTPAPAVKKGCTRAQQIRLANALNLNGHTNKDDMLRVASEWAGRQLSGPGDLTGDEANQFATELEDAAVAAAEGQNPDGVVTAAAADEPTDQQAADDAAWLARQTPPEGAQQ